MTTKDIRKELLSKIEQLPISRLQVVLNFVDELPEIKENSSANSDNIDLPVLDSSITDEDPLLGFIGQGNNGLLAHNIDSELYG
jgi:hypothetical protein